MCLGLRAHRQAEHQSLCPETVRILEDPVNLSWQVHRKAVGSRSLSSATHGFEEKLRPARNLELDRVAGSQWVPDYRLCDFLTRLKKSRQECHQRTSKGKCQRPFELANMMRQSAHKDSVS